MTIDRRLDLDLIMRLRRRSCMANEEKENMRVVVDEPVSLVEFKQCTPLRILVSEQIHRGEMTNVVLENYFDH